MLSAVVERVNDLVKCHVQPTDLHGFVLNDTVLSLALSAVINSSNLCRVADAVKALTAAVAAGAGATAVSGYRDAVVSAWRRPTAAHHLDVHSLAQVPLTMSIAKSVLQLATPGAMYRARHTLPQALLRSYMVEQQHFDLQAWLQQPGCGATEDANDSAISANTLLSDVFSAAQVHKHVVFTTSSDAIALVKAAHDDGSGRRDYDVIDLARVKTRQVKPGTRDS